MSEKKYSEMNATEKTAYMGFKHFSDRELKDRQAKAVERRVAGFRKFMGDLVALPHLELGKHMDEKALGTVFQKPINDFYDYATKSGLTPSDLEATVDNIIQCAFMIKRAVNNATSEQMSLTYALTGENNMADLPLKDIANLTEVAKDVFKHAEKNASNEYASEPSLSSAVDEVTDVTTDDTK